MYVLFAFLQAYYTSATEKSKKERKAYNKKCAIHNRAYRARQREFMKPKEKKKDIPAAAGSRSSARIRGESPSESPTNTSPSPHHSDSESESHQGEFSTHQVSTHQVEVHVPPQLSSDDYAPPDRISSDTSQDEPLAGTSGTSSSTVASRSRCVKLTKLQHLL